MRFKQYISEGYVSQQFEKLSSDTPPTQYELYYLVKAKPAKEFKGDHAIEFDPLGDSRTKRSITGDDVIMRIMRQGSQRGNSQEQLILDSDEFSDLFAPLKNASEDIEGYLEYEYKGKKFDVVNSGGNYFVRPTGEEKPTYQLKATKFNNSFRTIS